ncbi:MAG: IPT/TIG domain-containing protein [Nitrospiraceae bacterium]
MQAGMLKRTLIIALVVLMIGPFALMGHVPTALSAGSAEKEKAVETEKATGKEKQAIKTEKGKPESKEKPAEKGKPAKKEKGQPAKKSRITEGATKASGAGIVAKSTACFGQAPKIEKVSPDEVKAGDKVTITGQDFGAAGCLSSVSFGPGNQAKFQQKNETTVTATVPSTKKKGLVILTLTTASGEDSKPVLIK